MKKFISLKLIEGAGFFLISLLCFCYSLFGSNFAEYHVNLPFLNFPVFIGEIVLGFCLLILFVRCRKSQLDTWESWQTIVWVYGGWVVLKALLGYAAYGPLAFRNAALFYYPLFAVLAYQFYRRGWFTKYLLFVLLIAFMVVKKTINFSPYYLYTSFIIFIILTLKLRLIWLRMVFFVLIFILFPSSEFFRDAKSNIVGSIAAFFYLGSFLIVTFGKIGKKQALLYLPIVSLVIAFGLLRFSGKNQIEALTSPKNLWKQFQEDDRIIQEKKKTFKPKPLSYGLYNPDKVSLSDNVFLKVNPAGAKSLRIENAKDFNEKKVKGIINYNIEINRISIIRAIRDARENLYPVFKEGIDDVVFQKKAMDRLLNVADQATQASVDALEEKRSKMMTKALDFLKQLKSHPMPLGDAKNMLNDITNLSPEDTFIKNLINDVMHTIYSQKDIDFKAYRKYCDEKNETRTTSLSTLSTPQITNPDHSLRSAGTNISDKDITFKIKDKAELSVFAPPKYGGAAPDSTQEAPPKWEAKTETLSHPAIVQRVSSADVSVKEVTRTTKNNVQSVSKPMPGSEAKAETLSHPAIVQRVSSADVSAKEVTRTTKNNVQSVSEPRPGSEAKANMLNNHAMTQRFPTGENAALSQRGRADKAREIDSPLQESKPKKSEAEANTFSNDAIIQRAKDMVEHLEDGESKPQSTVSKRALNEEYGNMLFRLFIWRDMFQEMCQNPSSFLKGISFGKPQRSISLEILVSAYGEWMRDGWITPHNSYFHVLYRAGLVGLLCLIWFFAFIVKLTKQFVRMKSIVGLMLMSILVYWMTIANFLVIFELPYYSVPFWCLLGLTTVYAKNLKKAEV